ncbi:amidohydrolase family protein [Sporichthya polymorpha]|uniref:amidohydrolase family protein n=1 Tax=Sporichthya polymorpha TaxID=35751 RepID=UPI0003687FAD|nr:amidohydrolase family protein [Sporichthya polymorpha]
MGQNTDAAPDPREFPTIDIMNHPVEVDRSLGTDIFQFEEFKIMTRTTFKSVFGGVTPDPEVLRQAAALQGHADVAECVQDMDRLGYSTLVVCATKMWSFRHHHQLILDYSLADVQDLAKQAPDRVLAAASFNPFDITASLAEIDRAVREHDLRYVWFHPQGFGLPPNDRKFYPLYGKCAELGIAVGFQVGHSAEVLPSDVGRPMLADDVAIDFPDLRINLSHTGWPWVDEWCSMLWRHPNVYGDISAYFPKSLDERLVRFMNSSRGRDKVLFGTNGLGLERCKLEFLELPLSDKTRHAVLHDNAVRFLNLDGGTTLGKVTS